MFETETDGLYLVQTLKWWAIDPPALPPLLRHWKNTCYSEYAKSMEFNKI